MINIEKNIDCCGCYACAERCPTSCITMPEDKEGFVYPLVDYNDCIECALCIDVCPLIGEPKPERKPLAVFASKNKEEAIRLKSSSGGIFNLLAEKVINKGGVVFGVQLNGANEAVHTYVERVKDLYKLRGSKYVQSNVGNAFKEAESFLNQGRFVLFSGVPCHISGLYSFLGKSFENLLTVDVLCHGVPSPMVFRNYLKEQTAFGQSICNINFRDKKNGWKQFEFSYDRRTSNPTTIEKVSEFVYENSYMKGFLSALFIRPSCHECAFKKQKSGSDITLADYWQIWNEHPEFDDDKGVSMVLLNSTFGIEFFNELDSESFETSESDAYRYLPSYFESAKSHPKRSLFFRMLSQNNSVTESILKCTKRSIYQKVSGKMSRTWKRIFFRV